MSGKPNNASIAADLVAITRGDNPHVLLIQRGTPPFEGRWALPGGYVDPGETFEQAAVRELAEETGVRVTEVTEIGWYGRPDRDPRGRVVSVAYLALLDEPVVAVGADDAALARWVPVTEALRKHLGFDHDLILRDALRLRDAMAGGLLLDPVRVRAAAVVLASYETSAGLPVVFGEKFPATQAGYEGKTARVVATYLTGGAR